MLKRAPRPYIFVGPSAYGIDLTSIAEKNSIKWQPPVKRGDIEKIAETNAPGFIAIVDGVFHQSLAVGHAEIREAIKKGWQIWGLSSMGAIRAYEMRELGMRGYGEVFEYFFAFEDFRDDEVALVHEPAPTYRPLSEPLVHIRVALKELVKQDFITQTDAEQIIDELMNMWFGDRTLKKLSQMVLQNLGNSKSAEVNDWISSFQRFRIKTNDLIEFLKFQPWKK